MNYAIAGAGGLLFLAGLITGIGGCAAGADYREVGVCGWLAALVGSVWWSASYVVEAINNRRR